MTVGDHAADGGAVLALSGITKRFGDTLALDDVSLTVRRGTVHAVVGENGAGKTTLMRIAFGLIAADRGTISTAGANRAVRSAADAIVAGVGMVHQHFTNVPAMTVAENVALGGHGRFDATDAARRVVEIGTQRGLSLDPSARAESLPVGAQQRLEIVKALARDTRTLILDEPTAVLVPAEAEELLRWLRQFADGGNAVILVTHKLREALAIADDVTVLRCGRVVLTARASDVTTSSLAKAMLGEDLSTEPRRPPTSASGDVVASFENVDVRDERGVKTVHGVSIDVRSGEVLGVAGVEGAGQRELLRALAARAPVVAGRIRLPASIGFVPEDRQRDALVLDFTIPENIALKGAGSRQGRLSWRAFRDRSASLIRDFDIRGGSQRVAVRALSGGNQQKLVLARELDDRPALLVVESPTRGLDIRATADVHARLMAVADSGAAVVVYSSDLDEVLSLASRVLVMHAGRGRECARDRDAIGRAMLGVA